MSYTQHHCADAVQSLAESVCDDLDSATTLAAMLQQTIDDFVMARAADERQTELEV